MRFLYVSTWKRHSSSFLTRLPPEEKRPPSPSPSLSPSEQDPSDWKLQTEASWETKTGMDGAPIPQLLIGFYLEFLFLLSKLLPIVVSQKIEKNPPQNHWRRLRDVWLWNSPVDPPAHTPANTTFIWLIRSKLKSLFSKMTCWIKAEWKTKSVCSSAVVQ